jgi:hypothetical protein
MSTFSKGVPVARSLATHCKVKVTIEFVTEILPEDGDLNRDAVQNIREHYAQDPKSAFDEWTKSRARSRRGPQVAVLPLGPRTRFPRLKPKPKPAQKPQGVQRTIFDELENTA